MAGSAAHAHIYEHRHGATRLVSRHFVSTSWTLEGKGLKRSGDHKPTKAGQLVCKLLQEAGLYDEALDRLAVPR